MRLAITLASCTLPVVTPAVCTSPLSASTPMCAFIPKYHWFPFFDELISGSRFCSLFFVEGEAAISVASTIVPPRRSSPFAARCSATAAKIAFVSLMTLEQVTEIEDRRLVGDRVAAELQLPANAPID